MGGVCSTYEDEEECIQDFSGKSKKEKRQLVRS
jgi:hypothetical protein